VAVMATVAKGYDLDYAWRAVGEAYRGAGYYLVAAEAGEPPGTWWGQARNGWVSPRARRLSGNRTTCCSVSGKGQIGRSSGGHRRTPESRGDLQGPVGRRTGRR
jgi:hypothetical protein